MKRDLPKLFCFMILAGILILPFGCSGTHSVNITLETVANTPMTAGAKIYIKVWSYDPMIADKAADLASEALTTYADEDSLSFTINVDGIVEELRYYVTILVDNDDNEILSDGDYASSGFNNVLTQDNPSEITITLRLYGPIPDP